MLLLQVCRFARVSLIAEQLGLPEVSAKADAVIKDAFEGWLGSDASDPIVFDDTWSSAPSQQKGNPPFVLVNVTRAIVLGGSCIPPASHGLFFPLYFTLPFPLHPAGFVAWWFTLCAIVFPPSQAFAHKSEMKISIGWWGKRWVAGVV
jgi:hypothetical protein